MGLKTIRLDNKIVFWYYKDCFDTINLIAIFNTANMNLIGGKFVLKLEYLPSVIEAGNSFLKSYYQMDAETQKIICRTLLERNFIIL